MRSTGWLRFIAVIVSTITPGISVPAEIAKPHSVIVVTQGRNIKFQPQLNGLRDGLEELKYVEGKNLNWRLVEGTTDEELRTELRSALRRQTADVIVGLGTRETAIARDIGPHIPTVFLPAADPVRSGLIQTFTTPGDNVTGLTFFSDSQSVGKQLEVFKQVAPSLQRVLIISDRRLTSAEHTEYWNRLSTVASWLRLPLSENRVASPMDAARAVGQLLNSRQMTGVFVLCSGVFKNLEPLASSTIKRKFPLFGCNAFQVAEQRVLASYAPDLYSLGYRGAWFLDRIFKGMKPRDLPVETPRKFELVINTKIAEEIGLVIPRDILLLADRVFR